MRILTYTCPDCGTVISANELEDNREMKCPRLHCDTVLRFTDLLKDDRKFFLEHREQYQI